MRAVFEVRHAFFWLRSLSHEVSRKRALRFLLILAGLTVVGSGLLFYLIDANIRSVWTGMWYAWVTMTHVGLGDVVPSSFLGRLLSSLLILVGVGFFAVATALFAAVLVGHEMRTLQREVESAEQDITQMESAETRILLQLQTMERQLNLIEARLGRLEAVRKSAPRAE